MIDTIYIEEEIQEHPRVQNILKRFAGATLIVCERYGEVFNPRAQNYRIQKKRPALILAQKHRNRVLPAPDGYGIGGAYNFYFSHLLNCLYDCRYCFLQGMYQSANYVLFVNYEDFHSDIEQAIKQLPSDKSAYFFSGYDSDSLAFESVTEFVQNTLPFFRRHPAAVLELRTKSIHINPLLETEPMDNCIVAFSLNPDAVARAVEHKAPSITRRIEAMRRLTKQGWLVGLRFDPVIFHDDYHTSYAELFKLVFESLPLDRIHSISVGPVRFPKHMFEKILRLYPEAPVLAGPFEKIGSMYSYGNELENDMLRFCHEEIRRYAPEKLIFACRPESA